MTEKNRAAIGYTGEENENLVIPAYFVGDRENGTTEGRVYKVTSIEDLAFFRCYKLSRVTIPEGVTSIGEGAFYLCNLDSITISKNVANIGKEAFLGCTNLTSVTISEGVTSIGESAFEGCTNLTSITIPKSVTSIGKEAFLCCTNLTGVTISEGVTSIGEKTFDGCTNLTSITIPKSVTNIGFGVFVNCSKLTSIDVNAENNNYSSDNGVLFNKDKTELIRYPERKSGTTYTIPSSVTQITNNAFLGCYNLTNITIPEGVTSIEAYAFRSCGNLTSIIFNGTKEQWNAISKGTNWNGNTGSYTIYCTDGNIAK